jgi:tetratricopeptide (TPR) repeat protein
MKQQILDEVANGNISQAFQLLIQDLEQDGRFPKMVTAARLLQTEYNTHHEKELQGVTSSEENRLALNRAGKGILEILQEIESGVPSSTPISDKKKFNIWYVVIPVLILAGIGIGILINQNYFDSDDPKKPTADSLSQASTEPVRIACPGFSNNAPYKVSVLPFKALSSQQIAVQTQIVDEFGKNLLSESPSMRMVGLVNNFDVNHRYPDYPFADSLLKACGCDMIVWGNYLNEKEVNISFYCPLFQPEDRQSIDSLLQKRDQGEFTASIQIAVRILAARLYLAKGEPNKAIPIAQNVQKAATKEGSKTAKSIATMTLAQSYISTGQPEKAIQQYDTILSGDPHHPLALNNKAVLSVKQRHTDAPKDVDQAIAVNPSSVGLHLLATEESERNGDRNKAYQFLEKANKIAPNNVEVQKRFNDFPNEMLKEKTELTRKGSQQFKKINPNQ